MITAFERSFFTALTLLSTIFAMPRYAHTAAVIDGRDHSERRSAAHSLDGESKWMGVMEDQAKKTQERHEAELLKQEAQRAFGALLPGEIKLLDSAPSPNPLTFGKDASDLSPFNSEQWTDRPERIIRAELITWLATNPKAMSHVDAGGIAIYGAIIQGPFHMYAMTLPLPLLLRDCVLKGGIDLTAAHTRNLEFADDDINGGVNLTRAHTQNLVFNYSHIVAVSDDESAAFLGDGMEVDGDLSMIGARMEGETWLDDAKIHGDFVANAAQLWSWAYVQVVNKSAKPKQVFSDDQTKALSAEYAQIDGSVRLSSMSVGKHNVVFRSIGSIELQDAKIDQDLDCGDAYLWDPRGHALDAFELRLRGDVQLQDVTADGDVFFDFADIHGTIWTYGATFKNPGEEALSITYATIHSDVMLGNDKEGLTTDGIINLQGAKIGGALHLQKLVFIKPADKGQNKSKPDHNGVNAQFITVDGPFYWKSVSTIDETSIDLSYARAGVLADDTRWPAQRKLNGFQYQTIDRDSPHDSQRRLEWLRTEGGDYEPQPYSQLARVLASDGHGVDAVDVQIADEQARRAAAAHGRNAPEKLVLCLWSWLLRWTIGYGHRPFRAMLPIAGFIILGSYIFGLAFKAGVITPTEKDAYDEFTKTGEAPVRYQSFSNFVYSLETFVPLVRLRQEEFWQPNPRQPAAREVCLFGKLSRHAHRCGSRFSQRVRYYLWIHTLAGWILTPLFVAGLTGLVKSAA